MNESYTLLWVQAFDVAILVAAVGCLLWTFHKEVEAIAVALLQFVLSVSAAVIREMEK